ncbi:unnamed protein product [Didymodactylos carnosus]|uniref:Uncharacterized protein n=1 Tax=Didymodactylos carnosus TaxID=1234261 RepID=A0A814V2W0_9BILA|nr:unnamed protein product [Didymodactylos carnosus]CAF1183366.1 unnamed protein product [Didymodactylos carnosus]CAF3626928.1 unnamed protein product [Didymodactylos carnosus]CAF3947689.1 unnamed protein product [Didymodactylos carnosus]
MSMTSENEQQLWKLKQLNDNNNNNFILSTKVNKDNQVLTFIPKIPYRLKLAPLDAQSTYQQCIFVLTNYPNEPTYRIKSKYLETIGQEFHLDLLNDETAENSYRVTMRQQGHYSGQYWKLIKIN